MISKSVIKLVTIVLLLINFNSEIFAQENLNLSNLTTQSKEFVNNGSGALFVADNKGTVTNYPLTSHIELRLKGTWWNRLESRFWSVENYKGSSNKTVFVRFKNNTKHKISIYWVNNGSEKRYLQINKYEEREQATFENHLWRVKIGKRVIANYKATNASSQLVEVVSTDVDAGSISNKRDAERKCSKLASGANQTWSGKWKKSSEVCELIKLNTQVLKVKKPAPRSKPTSIGVVNCPENPAPNEVLLYTEENFQGECTSYVGFNREVKSHNSNVRSVKVGSGIRVSIYRWPRFKRRSIYVSGPKDVSIFDPEKKAGKWRSLRIRKKQAPVAPAAPKPCAGLNKPNPGVEAAAEQVTIFTEPNFGGSCKTIDYKGRDQKPYPYSIAWNYESRDKFYNNGDMRKRKPPFNSIMIGSGVVVTVCTGKNFRGTCKDFRESVGDLTDEGFAYNSINSFKIYTLNPKKYVNPALPNDNQVTICQQRNFGGGCRKLDVGIYSFRGIAYQYIHVGKNVKAQAFEETFQYGDFEVYSGGTKQATARKFKSIRVLNPDDQLAEQKERRSAPVATPAPTPDVNNPVTVENRENIFISTVDGSKCLAVKGGQADEYTPVVLANCRDIPSQRWSFSTDGRIRGLANMCLTRSRRSLIVETCDGLGVQAWIVTSSNQLANAALSRCLSSNGGSPNSVNCDTKSEQRWLFQDQISSPEVSEKSGRSAAPTQPVVLPVGSNFRQVRFPISRAPLADVSDFYDVNDSSGTGGIRYGSAEAARAARAARLRNRTYYFNFVVNRQGAVFYAPFSGNSGGFNSNFDRYRQATVRSGSKIVKVAGTFQNSRGTSRMPGVYAINQRGQIVRANYNGTKDSPGTLGFTAFSTRARFVDIFLNYWNETLVGLASDGTIHTYSLSDGQWKANIRSSFTKIVANGGYILGVTKAGEVFAINTSGGEKTKLLNDVRDLAIEDNSRLCYVSSGNGLLMQASIDGKSVGREELVDEKGTFTGFVSKRSCLVQNGNGQTYLNWK